MKRSSNSYHGSWVVAPEEVAAFRVAVIMEPYNEESCSEASMNADEYWSTVSMWADFFYKNECVEDLVGLQGFFATNTMCSTCQVCLLSPPIYKWYM